MRWMLVASVALATASAVFFVYRYRCQHLEPQLFVINVLDKQLYNECHIQGSIHVPFVKVRSWAQKVPKNSTIVVYCSNYMCAASAQAARLLQKMNFADVYAYEAGMHEWYHAGLPVTCSVESDYLHGKNPALEHAGDQDVAVITTDELKKMMLEHGFFD